MKSLAVIKCCRSLLRLPNSSYCPGVIAAHCRSYSSSNTVEEPPIPEYKERYNEDISVRKARLLYQSRKRGMLENGLLLSTFAAKYLNSFNEKQTELYDRLINKPTNDWEIYYWAIGNKPTPEEYNNEIMDLLKKHASNEQQDDRSRQPDLA